MAWSQIALQMTAVSNRMRVNDVLFSCTLPRSRALRQRIKVIVGSQCATGAGQGRQQGLGSLHRQRTLYARVVIHYPR